MLRCTSTLSITTWKNSGETSAKSCRKNEATSTSPSSGGTCGSAPRNQVMSKRRDRSVRRRAGSSARAGRPRPPRARRGSSVRARRVGRLDQDLVVAGLAEEQEAAVAQDGDAGQRRAWPAGPTSL